MVSILNSGVPESQKVQRETELLVRGKAFHLEMIMCESCATLCILTQWVDNLDGRTAPPQG